MKLHKILCQAVVHGLQDILILNLHAHHTVEKLLQSDKRWGARDRNFIADTIYHIVRYKRLYSFAIDTETIADTQLWQLLAASLLHRNIELPPWEEWATIDIALLTERLEQGAAIRKIRESVPDWLDALGEKEYGKKWDAELHALNQPAKLCIRINTLRSSKKRMQEWFEKEGIIAEENATTPDAFVLQSRKNLAKTLPYLDGEIEVQDVSSQLVAPALDVRAGMTVIDACAGAGGKTLHIATLLKNEGEIIAIDIHNDKLNELDKRARRNGVSIIRTILMNEDMFDRYYQYADRLLLDVPCSGSGVLKRHPDDKWKLTPDFVQEMVEVQKVILHKNEAMLKPGGKLVYATCSIFPDENERQIARFLKKHPNFTKLNEHKISPADSGFDGFYICVMQKKI